MTVLTNTDADIDGATLLLLNENQIARLCDGKMRKEVQLTKAINDLKSVPR